MNVKRWLPFLMFLLFFGTLLVAKNTGRMGWFFDWVNNAPYGDKIGHVFLIGGLALLFNVALSWRKTSVARLRVQLGGLIILVLMTAEEISQMWISTRSFDLIDLAANFAGVVVAELLSRYLQHRRSTLQS